MPADSPLASVSWSDEKKLRVASLAYVQSLQQESIDAVQASLEKMHKVIQDWCPR